MKYMQIGLMSFLCVITSALHAGPFIKKLTNTMPDQRYSYAIAGVCSVDFGSETVGKPQDLPGNCDLSRGSMEIHLNRGYGHLYVVKRGSSPSDIEINVQSSVEKGFDWNPNYKEVPVGTFVETEWTDDKGNKVGGIKGGRNFTFHSMKESGNYHLILNGDGTVHLEEL